MKKVFSRIMTCVLALTMLFSVAACGGETVSKDPKFEIASTLSLKEGYTSQITPTGVENVESFSYLSDDDEVATVTDKGLVTAVSEGSATISVAGGTLIKQVTVTVEKNEVNGISVKKLNAIAAVNEEAQIGSELDDAWNFGWGKDTTPTGLAAKMDFANVAANSAKILRGYTDAEKYSSIDNGAFTIVMIAGANTEMTEATTPEGAHVSVYSKVNVHQRANSFRVWGMSWKDDVVAGNGQFRVTALTKNSDNLSYSAVSLSALDMGTLTQNTDGYISFSDTRMPDSQIIGAPDNNMFVFKTHTDTYDIRNKEVVIAIEFRAVANTLGANNANKQSRFGIKRMGFIVDPAPDFTITSPASLIMEVNETANITTTVVGDVSEESFTYESKDETIATVSLEGVITAKKVGETKINVKNGDLSKEITVKVAAGSFKVPAEVKVNVNGTLAIVPTDVVGIETFTYTVENENIAVVSTGGVVTGKALGSTTVLVKGGDLIKRVTVNVLVSEIYGKNIEFFKNIAGFTADEVDIEVAGGANVLNFVSGWGATGTNSSKISLDNSAANTDKIIRGYSSTETNKSLIQVEDNWMNLICGIGALPEASISPDAAMFFKATVPNKPNFRVWTFGGAADDVVSAKGKFRVAVYVPNADFTDLTLLTLVKNFQEAGNFVVEVDADGWITYENSLDGFLAFTVPDSIKGKEVIISIEVEGRTEGKQDRFMVKRMGFCG